MALLERLIDEYEGLDVVMDELAGPAGPSTVQGRAWKANRHEDAAKGRLLELLQREFGERYHPKTPRGAGGRIDSIASLPQEAGRRALTALVIDHHRRVADEIVAQLPGAGEPPGPRRPHRAARQPDGRDRQAWRTPAPGLVRRDTAALALAPHIRRDATGREDARVDHLGGTMAATSRVGMLLLLAACGGGDRGARTDTTGMTSTPAAEQPTAGGGATDTGMAPATPAPADTASTAPAVSDTAGKAPSGAAQPAAPAKSEQDTAKKKAAAKPAAGGAGGAQSPQQVALGDSIFHGQVGGGTCTACHGQDAKGTAVAPDLTDAKWINGDGSYDFIVKTVTAGVPKPKEHPAPMPPKGGAQLTDDQVKAVAGLRLLAEPQELRHQEPRHTGPRRIRRGPVAYRSAASAPSIRFFCVGSRVMASAFE